MLVLKHICILVPAIDFQEVRDTLQTLSRLIPENEFYKYNDLWSRSTQQACFLIIFQSYLEKGEIINIIPTVEETLNGKYKNPVVIARVFD